MVLSCTVCILNDLLSRGCGESSWISNKLINLKPSHLDRYFLLNHPGTFRVLSGWSSGQNCLNNEIKY